MDYNFFHILPIKHTLSSMIKSLFSYPIIQQGSLSKPVTNSQLMMKTSESLHIGKTVKMTMAAFCLSSLVTSAAAQGGGDIISFFHDATKVRNF
jgi:hypothetical protein